MNKSFLKEVRRIDDANRLDKKFFEGLIQQQFEAWVYEHGLFDDDAYSSDEIEEKLDATVAGKLALEFDNSKGKFENDHLWYLYFDRWAVYPEPIKDNVELEADLRACLGFLELDGVFLFETQKLPENAFFKTLPISKYIVPDGNVSDYCQKIVKECYRKGKFETPLWKIENNIVSSRFK